MRFIRAIVMAAALFGAAMSLRAQETGGRSGSSVNDGNRTDSLRGSGGRFEDFRPNGFETEGLDVNGLRAESSRRYPDIETWQTEEEFVENMFRNPSVSMTSTVEVVRNGLPRRIIVLPNNTVRIWRVNVSNGSAGNWGSFPNSYLDARTLSFPAPR